jgi:hypothetical protein
MVPTEVASVLEPTPMLEAAVGPGLQYDLRAALDWNTHIIEVEQQVVFQNRTGRLQNLIVFNVEINQEPGQFVLKSVRVAGHDITTYTLDGVRLAVPLSEHLEKGASVEISLVYELHLPAIQEGSDGLHPGYWGYSTRQINLGMWFPLVAMFNQEWITPLFYTLGEQSVLQIADFVAELTIQNAPTDVLVAGPGVRSRPDSKTWRFELRGGRDLTLSISDQFNVLNTTTANGIAVELFYFRDMPSLDAPHHALQVASDAVALYDEIYCPYSYDRLVVVQGDFPDGMEFSGLVFVGDAWFRRWQNIPNDWLTVITAHEVAHQWWYAMIGNDQGNYPYIDEALAIYSEELFIEHYYPEYLDWWWDFRIRMYEPTGYVDANVYEFYSLRSYINAVYLRGALMMDELRDDLGNAAFLAWLHDYAVRMNGELATPIDFWNILTPNDYMATAATRRSYFRQANVLTRPGEIP